MKFPPNKDALMAGCRGNVTCMSLFAAAVSVCLDLSALGGRLREEHVITDFMVDFQRGGGEGGRGGGAITRRHAP